MGELGMTVGKVGFKSGKTVLKLCWSLRIVSTALTKSSNEEESCLAADTTFKSGMEQRFLFLTGLVVVLKQSLVIAREEMERVVQ
jgi:hypothetical protein